MLFATLGRMEGCCEIKESDSGWNGRVDFPGAADLPGKTGRLKWVKKSFPVLQEAFFVKSFLAVFSFEVAV